MRSLLRSFVLAGFFVISNSFSRVRSPGSTACVGTSESQPLVARWAKRRDPDDEARERLQRLENVMLKVVKDQADRIEVLEKRVVATDAKLNELRADLGSVVALIRDAGLLDGGGASTEHFSAEEAFAALADVLLRASEDRPSKGFRALPAKIHEPQDGPVDISSLSSDSQRTNTYGRRGSSVSISPDDRPPTEAYGFEARTTEARLMEALDVPDDLYDAADSSGAALLAALLCGHRRMRVDIADPSLGGQVLPSPNTLTDDINGAILAESAVQSLSEEYSSDSTGSDNDPLPVQVVEHERLARFVELMCLPIAAAMEGLEKRVHVVFSSVRQLAAARSAMAHTATVALGALSLDAVLEPQDSVVVLVAPTSALESQAEELLASAVNRTIIVVNPSFDESPKTPLAREIAQYEPVYVLRSMAARYGDKGTSGSDAHLASATFDGYLDSEEPQSSSPWGGLRDFSFEMEAAALEEVGLSMDLDSPQPYSANQPPSLTTREAVTTDEERDGINNDNDDNNDKESSRGGEGALGSLGTEDWAAAAAAAVAESVLAEDPNVLGEENADLAALAGAQSKSAATSLRENFPESASDSDPKKSIAEVQASIASADEEAASADNGIEGNTAAKLHEEDGCEVAGGSESSDWQLSHDVRTMLLREFPMPWRVFLQLTNCFDADTEQPLEQPWILVDSFEAGEPSRSEVNLAVMAYISEELSDGGYPSEVSDLPADGGGV